MLEMDKILLEFLRRRSHPYGERSFTASCLPRHLHIPVRRKFEKDFGQIQHEALAVDSNWDF